MPRRLLPVLAAATFLALGPLAALAGPGQPVGEKFRVDPSNLAEPSPGTSVVNPPRRIRRPSGVLPMVPKGFKVNIFAENLAGPRWLAVADNGDVLVAESARGRVTLLRDNKGRGVAGQSFVIASGLQRPHGLAVRAPYFYVADTEAVWRFKYRPGQTTQSAKPRQITKDGALGQGKGHWTRNIAFHPDGAYFFVTVGSRSNLNEEPMPHASVQRFQMGGKAQTTFAWGLRNPVGIAFRPGTKDLYVVVNERDRLGDGLVPDYLTRIREGDFFGWPYAYIGNHLDPDFGVIRPDKVKQSKMPDLLFRSHSAALGLVFYDRGQFPVQYQGGAFVALHGSWNARKPQGYMVVYVPFAEDGPAGHYTSFMTGFWSQGENRASVWGRPVGLALAKDGSLLVADDSGGVVWRVSYKN